MRICPYVLDPSVTQLRIELAPHGLDLWQLGHAAYITYMSGHEIDPEGLPYLPQNLPRKPDIGAAVFGGVDMRAGRIVEVEELPGARKPAWKLGVDFGPAAGTLRTSAQVKNYTRGDLLGRLVVGALNLGKKRIAGFESEFLILGALDPDGTVRLLQLEEGVEPGAPIA